MATKNVKIIPISGSLELSNGSGGKYIFTITGNSLDIQDERDVSLMKFQLVESSDSPQMNIDNSSNFIIPILSSPPESLPEGAIIYDESTDSIFFGDTNGDALSLQGPTGSKGNIGTQGFQSHQYRR